MRLMLRRPIICALAVTLIAVQAAAAGTIGVTLGLVPGKLVVRAQPAVVDGTASLAVRVADGRGNGHGWTLRFRTGSGVVVTGIKAMCATGSTCTLPTAVGPPDGTTVLRAARDTGMGSMILRVTVQTPAPTSVGFEVS
jgi:hypothetical protein